MPAPPGMMASDLWQLLMAGFAAPPAKDGLA